MAASDPTRPTAAEPDDDPRFVTRIVTRRVLRSPARAAGAGTRVLEPGERPGAAAERAQAERALAEARVRRVRSADGGAPTVVATPPLTTPRRRGVSSAICGQAALAYASGQSLDAVIRAVGHDGPMLFREIKRFLEQRCHLTPTVILADALRSDAVRLWWQYGGDAFRAILGDLRHAPTSDDITREALLAGAEPPTPLGHVVVVEGRTLVDLGGRGVASVQRFAPRDLARFDAALVLSASCSPSGRR